MKKRLLVLVAALLMLAISTAQADAWFPELTVSAPTKLKTTLSAMGIDIGTLTGQIPAKCDVVVYDGIPQYPDHGYISVSLMPEALGTEVNLTLKDGVWYLPESVTFADLTKGYMVYFNLGDDLYVYNGLANFYKVGIDGNRLIYTAGDSYALTMSVSGQGLTARYGLDGIMQYYSIASGDADGCRVYYTIDNAVEHAELRVDGVRYAWYADKGWYRVDASAGTETACTAPAGYESYDAAAFAARCPSPNEVLPQPLYGLVKPFSISGPLEYELKDMNIPMYAINEAVALGDGVVAENGQVYVQDRQYDEVTLWADSTTFRLTLQNDRWVDPEGRLTPQRFEKYGYTVWLYRDGRYGSEEITYNTNGALYSYDIYDLQGNRLFLQGGRYYVIYTNDAGHVVEAQFGGIEGAEKLMTPYYVYKDGGTYITVKYRLDGTLYEAEIAGKDGNYCYSEAKGWYDPYTLKSCSAAPGFADYTAADFMALCPPEICYIPPTPVPTATPVPTPTLRPVRNDLGMDAIISVKDGLYSNAVDQGIDLNAMEEAVHRPTVTWVDGLPAVVDDQYITVWIRSEKTWDEYGTKLQDGTWVLEDPQNVPPDAFDEGYTVTIHAWYEGASFIDGEELYYINVRPQSDEYYLQAYVNDIIWLERDINGYSIEAEFNRNYSTDPLVSYSYNFVENETMHVTYFPSGELSEVTILEHGMSIYWWDPQSGWLAETDGYLSSCDTPAGLEYVTEEYITGKYPPIDVIGYVPPAEKTNVPVAKPSPSFRMPKALYLDLSDIGVNREEILADLPDTDGAVWKNGFPTVPDHGYDAVTLASSLYTNQADLVLTDGVWQLDSDEFTADDFRYGYATRITIGDWTYVFNGGELYQVFVKDYLIFNSFGSYEVTYETSTMTVNGVYNTMGKLQNYEVTVKKYPELFIQLDASNNVIKATTYGDGIYVWTPGGGWTYESWAFDSVPTPCDPPAGYEVINAAWMAKNVIPQVGGVGGETITAPTSYANKLAAGLLVVEEEAFLGSSITDCYLPDGLTTIGANAFKDCVELTFIRIPATVKEIAHNAFDGCGRVVIVTPEGSKAEAHAEAYGITCITE